MKYLIFFALSIFTISCVDQKLNSKKKVNLMGGKGGNGGKSENGKDGEAGKDGKNGVLNIELK
ncbi:hypothetical protein EGI22_06605 [Lacihabitans sp. LS3-19]|uniref:hypothetical protein n=1 Tax=Lacihabitans sp. LS3-19 TaxID=2487335 RepID=UPI0020CD2DE3|nr:hypothetical protein [Lacihabitans sp. LS3-19]MCP9767576.1 hypothetical protein [Lacihabitans sp. LS3-19]